MVENEEKNKYSIILANVCSTYYVDLHLATIFFANWFNEVFLLTFTSEMTFMCTWMIDCHLTNSNAHQAQHLFSIRILILLPLKFVYGRH